MTFPDGSISKMEGFLVEGKDIRIATDSTLNGNGTMYNPLRISPTETTGTFAPADEYFDLSAGLPMPEGKGKGYRVVTKEKIDNFGCLYPYSAVEKIQAKLEETKSQWRVATKQDWDELLNAYECAENRNHNSATCAWLGKDASVALKSVKFWDKETTTRNMDSVAGQDIAGLSVYPLGITPDRNEILNAVDDNHDAEGFGKIAGMWTSTLNPEGNAYVKIFGFNEGRVDQDTYGTGARMSIRLVKDYAYSNYNEIETILGFPYPTEMVYGPYEDSKYLKIWTKINFYSDAETLNGIRSDEWSAVTDSDKGVEIVYFINEWDGTEWHKKPMENGDSVVIIDREGFPYHEWRIIEGELIDTAEALAEEFNRDFAEVKEDIAELSAMTKELITFCGWTIDTINEFSAATEEHINRIDATISEFSAATIAEFARVDADVAFVSGAVDTVSAITTENIQRIDADVTFLSGTVDTFSAATVGEIARIDADVVYVSGAVDTVSAITTENIQRIDADVAFVSGAVDTVSAITTENIQRIDADVVYVSGAVDTVSAITTENIQRIDADITFLSGTVDTFSAATVAEINRLDGKDVEPGTYVLDGDTSSEMVIPTYSDEVADIKIKVSEDFFDFGTF